MPRHPAKELKMAKKEQKESEEKGEFKTLNEAFTPEESEVTETKLTEDELKVEQEDTTEEPEKGAEETAKLEETAEVKKTWKDLGIDRFDGMSREQQANEINWRNRVAGQQANELGELRKKVAELEKSPEKPEEKAPVRRGLTEAEIADYNKILEGGDPVGAFLKYGGDDFKQIISEAIKSEFQGGLKDIIGGQVDSQADSLAYSSFCQNHPDYETYEPLMQTLDGKEHLREQKRSYEELYELAKLGEDNDPLYEPTYSMLKKYPNMNVVEAKKFASLQLSNPEAAQTKRDKIKETVGKIDVVNKATAKKSASTNVEKPESIDDAFNIED